jgi:hypothetical protein
MICSDERFHSAIAAAAQEEEVEIGRLPDDSFLPDSGWDCRRRDDAEFVEG